MLWDFSSKRRQGWRPKSVHAPGWSVFGSAFHEGLRAYYQYEDYEKAFLEAYTDCDANENETRQVGTELLRSYANWAKRTDDFSVVDMEQTVDVQLGDTVIYRFRYDGLVKDVKGNYWIKEFKTAGQIPRDLDWLSFDFQMIAYQLGMTEFLGFPIKGSIYTFIWKKMPSVPEVLKRGGLSKKKIKTTYATYLAALQAYASESGEDIEQLKKEYGMHLMNVQIRESLDFFKRITIKSSAKRCGFYKRALVNIGLEMTSGPVIYPSPNKFSCQNCAFSGPCYIRLGGGDPSKQLSLYYDRRSDAN